jgi:hypothetical protein
MGSFFMNYSWHVHWVSPDYCAHLPGGAVMCACEACSWGSFFGHIQSLKFWVFMTWKYWLLFAAFIPWWKWGGSTGGDHQSSRYTYTGGNQVYESQLHRVQVPANQGSSLAQSMFTLLIPNTLNFSSWSPGHPNQSRVLCWFLFNGLQHRCSTNGCHQKQWTWSQGFFSTLQTCAAMRFVFCPGFFSQFLLFLLMESEYLLCGREHYYHVKQIMSSLTDTATLELWQVCIVVCWF